MKAKAAILISVALLVGLVLGWILTSHPTVQPGNEGQAVSVAATQQVAVAPEISAPKKTEAPVAPAPAVPASRDNNSNTIHLDTAQADPPIKINGYELQDPLARIALSFVGADSEADAYWIGAINDSAVPAEERKDLIEDLNEDGLSDPRHPSTQDMPLILRRIRLIEQLAPTALDDVNRDALAEAYKDLVGLLNGEPPQ